MTTSWTNIPKASVTSWTKIPKSSEQNITGGDPIGLLLALTYSTASNQLWTNITKASGTVWTKITKAT